MTRLLICLPFLLFFAFLYPRTEPVAEDAPLNGQVSKAVLPVRPKSEWLSMFASSPGAGFPGALAWPGVFQTVQAEDEQSDQLPDSDILVFLQKCIERYDREVTGYKCTLYKQERLFGKLQPVEVVHAEFREQPHSVYMKWEKGARDASAVVFVRGQNDNKILVKPRLLPWITWEIDINGPKAKNTSRYTIDEFGIRLGMERTLKAWKERQAENKLHVEYEGVFFVSRAGNKLCYKIHRSKFERPEDDGVMDVIIYIDLETWLQVGTTLLNGDGEIVAEYYFSDLQLNPDFPPNYFNRSLLKK